MSGVRRWGRSIWIGTLGALALVLGIVLIWRDKVDPLLAELNVRFPPTSEWTVRSHQTAIAQAEIGRGLIWEGHLAISAPQIVEMLNAQLTSSATELAQQGVTFSKTTIGLSDQAITVAADVAVMVAQPPLEFTARVEGVAVPAALGDTVELRSAFTRIQLTSLRWGKERPRDASAALPVLQTAVNAVMLRVNGVLRPTRTTLALVPFKPITPASVQSGQVGIKGTPLVPPLPQVGAVAFLVTPKGLRALVNVGLPEDVASPVAAAVTDDPTATEASFKVLQAKLEDSFRTIEDNTFGVDVASFEKRVRMIVTRRFIARAFNQAASKLDWTVTVTQPRTEQPFDSEVRLLKVPDPQTCSQHVDQRDCSPHSCSQGHDERDCRTCIIPRPWPLSGCAQYGNNPFCELAKAAQNKLYEGEATLCRADALRLKGQCEAEKGAQNMLYSAQAEACRAGDVLIRQLTDLAGRVGRVSGIVKFDAAGEVKIGTLQFLPDLTVLNLSATVQARAQVEAEISFVQSDLLGHLLCTFPIKDRTVRATAALGPSHIEISSTLEGDPPRGVILVTNELEVAFTMRPPPAEALFAQNPDLMITCQGAGVLAALGGGMKALGLQNLPSAFTGDFKHKLESQRIPLEWTNVDVPVPGSDTIRLVPKLRVNGLLLESAT